MATSRIDVFKQILRDDPGNTTVKFGLAKELEKTGAFAEVIQVLEDYLATAEDEGNGYGMLATAYEKIGNRNAARTAYETGIKIALAHGHPSMAADYQMCIDSDYSD